MTSSFRYPRLHQEPPTATEFDVAVAATRYWAAQDVDLTVSMFAEDIVYQLYVSRCSKPFGIERIGLEAMRAMLFDLLADFDYVNYASDILEAAGGVVRIQSRYRMRHRASGEELAGSKRFVCTVRGGLFTRIHEYHDAVLVEAFLELAKWRLREEGRAAGFRIRWPIESDALR